jgi:hypothetical protein
MLLHNPWDFLLDNLPLKPDSLLVILLMIFSSWRIQMSGLAHNRFSQVYASTPFACYSCSRHPGPAEEIFAGKRFADWEPEVRYLKTHLNMKMAHFHIKTSLFYPVIIWQNKPKYLQIN